MSKSNWNRRSSKVIQMNPGDYWVSGGPRDAPMLQDGDRVRLKVQQIKRRKNWPRMNEKYKEFIEGSKDKIFTVKLKDGAVRGVSYRLATLVEEPMWYFWQEDLMLVKDEEE